uniref:Uncharacterized protein n=1 Tax=Chromera velia CCMP2878 TaxID=1169474 RepID=A0A0G4HCH2_9ALVE|eukprot:Cvel_26120.t1-p1 / transcript=Cvel_26120.t1 / gene=Cvel_26120 / organism=Chromera_velia_CCMP2878 / gene_product=hypothetical protein / transcript_product=hypothetical protein / location=Cvel_scaffold3056:13705-14187(+) / protein_length=161 / sequence_SO=supercontig / SO=protein_coding / is_pseudo=false
MQMNLQALYSDVRSDFYLAAGPIERKREGLMDRLRAFKTKWRIGSIGGQQGGKFPPSMDEEHLQQPLPSSRKLRLRRTREVTAGTPSTAEVLHKHRQKLQGGEGNGVGRGLLFGSHPFPTDRAGRGWGGGPLQQQQGQGGLGPFAGLSKQQQSGGGVVEGG